MSERLTAWVPVLLLGSLAALTFWLDRAVRPAPQERPLARGGPDYVVDGLSAVRMDSSGVTAYTLSARRMTHYPDDDTTVLEAPKFVSLGPNKPPVTITAKEALVSPDGEHVYFQDDVVVTRAAQGRATELAMRTNFLHVMPEKRLARTDRPVTITDAATVVHAVGLEFDSETRIVKLLSNVRGTYDPGKAPPRGSQR